MPKNSKNGEAAKDSCPDRSSGEPADKGCRTMTAKAKEKPGRRYSQTIFYDWCKACGICIAFCPQEVFRPNKQGKPVVAQPDQCTGCGFCEIHCPDFAITIAERPPQQHKEKS
ncbi:MAG: 4Fe-4S dicluster domain-containing protein [Desulfobulbaceae bacterium]|nr:4Fe-4S dicluster domain-containing protein [Desulfobulbaceae bacterium]